MKRLRAWLRTRRTPPECCDICDTPSHEIVKIVAVIDDLEFGGGTAMVAKFCPDHAPKET